MQKAEKTGKMLEIFIEKKMHFLQIYVTMMYYRQILRR